MGTLGPAMSLEALRARMAELSDLTALARLASWDQRTMMPPAGGPWRGEQLATLERLAHERATADEVGAWLDELESTGLADLDAEIERAASDGQNVWQAARAAGDFGALEPALRRNVELAREYAACFQD